MTSSLTLRRAAPLILLVVGCHDGIDAPSAPIDRAISLAAMSLIDQTGTVGSAVASPPAVIVRDASGNPVAGVRVSFYGAIAATALTGSDGIATIEWVLSTRPGSYTVVAHTGKLNSVQFTASAVLGPPAYVSAMTPLDQAVVAGSSVPDTPAVIVAQRRLVPGALDTLLEPFPLRLVGERQVLDAERAAIGAPERGQQLAEGRGLQAAEGPAVHRPVQVRLAKAELVQIEERV
jgi:hypothetical protein